MHKFDPQNLCNLPSCENAARTHGTWSGARRQKTGVIKTPVIKFCKREVRVSSHLLFNSKVPLSLACAVCNNMTRFPFQSSHLQVLCGFP